VQLEQPLPDDGLVVLNDKPTFTLHQDAPPKEDKINWFSYRKSDRTLMMNSNSKDPTPLGQMLYGRKVEPFIIEHADYWHVRNIEFSWSVSAFILYASNCVVENCFFTHSYRPAIFFHGRTNIIRGCSFYKCGYGISCSGVGPANLLEDNLMIECGQSAEEDINNIDVKYPEGGGPTVFKGNNLAMVFIYNTIADNPGTGWYADIDAKSCRIIGNAFWNNQGGIYNEYAVDDTIVMGNYFYQNDLTSAMCTRLHIYDNFLEDCGVIWHIRDWWPIRNSFMVLRGNAILNPPNGYLSHYSAGWGQTSYPEGFTNSLVDYNQMRIKDGGVFINDGGAGKKYHDLDEIRKQFGWEIHGQAKVYDKDKNDLTPESMGGSTVTYRVPWGKRSYLARPMLANADIENKWPCAPEFVQVGTIPSYFWRFADGNYCTDPVQSFEPWFPYHSRWQAGSGAGYGLGENAGARWYIDAEQKYPEDLIKKLPKDWKAYDWPTVTALSKGNHWLVLMGMTPEKMPPQGLGYWSPLLTTAADAAITVSFKIRGKDIEASENGTAAICMMFTNETGQKITRAYIIGKDAQGKVHRPEYTKGSFDWVEVKETITAPKDAVRMALFLGILPCKGTYNFDDINIKTASAVSTEESAEILLPRLPIEKFREVFKIDLSKVANRALADEKENDGVGGWSDQGPDCDMRELKTGDLKLGGVPMRILPPPNCVVVLKASTRAAGKLPEKVEIPVGKKLDTLFFLHAAAWAGGPEFFRYVIHYADGKDETISVGPQNMIDWGADPVRRFPNETGTFTTVAQTVKVPMLHHGSIYRMEWSAPRDRRAVEIKSIEFIGNGNSVPILLGITGVLEW
jgi:hypothetical protein